MNRLVPQRPFATLITSTNSTKFFKSVCGLHSNSMHLKQENVAPPTPSSTENEDTSDHSPLSPKHLLKQEYEHFLEIGTFKTATLGKTSGYVTGQDHPFPMNPYFKPPKPLSEKTKKELFGMYQSNPKQWTPRALALHFGISIVRTHAILRLKSLEMSMKKDKIPLQTDLTKGMEKLLRSQTLNPLENKSAYEPLRSSYGLSITPLFHFIEETESFTPEVSLSYYIIYSYILNETKKGCCSSFTKRSFYQY
jgi:hypothetical protein